MPCTTVLVGKKASFDGSTMIARNDDGGYDVKKVVVNKANQNSKYKCVISKIEVELPKKSLKYTSIPNVNKQNGLWPACGINEANVAMTATETITSNPLVYAADPLLNRPVKGSKDKTNVGGIGEEDLVTLVLPYIKTAREGVIRMGQLLEKYGTYESNGMAFADENEIWWLETIGGHHFIAIRVPDDKVVMAPNWFSADSFDIKDAYSKQINNMCSKDLKDFIKNSHLDSTMNGKFNPRVMFGSHTDQDHLYNTPRLWYMLKYFNPTVEGYTPVSDDMPFTVTPVNKVTIQDVKYVLSSYYQSTEYNPYTKSESAGKYRTIGVPNSDDSVILQIRPYMPKQLKGVEWITLGGSVFTAVIPQYVNVDKFSDYLSNGTETVNTNNFYWQSRLIAALTDAQYLKNIIFSERYISSVLFKSYQILHEYDEKMMKSRNYTLCEEANSKIVALLKKESDSVLKEVLRNCSDSMKTRYHRNDN